MFSFLEQVAPAVFAEARKQSPRPQPAAVSSPAAEPGEAEPLGADLASEIFGHVASDATPEEAIARAKALLAAQGPMTSDADAVAAMRTLSDLPKEQRAQAIDKLPYDAFTDLVIAIPPGRAEELKDLMDATTNPERKLLLWQRYQKARTAHLVKDASADSSDAEKGALGRAEQGDLAEIDEETRLLREKAKAKKLTMSDVEELQARKEEELRIEVAYGVNLTNAWSDDKERWTFDKGKGDLEKIENALKLMPAEDRHNVTEYRRVHNNPASPGAGAEHFGGDGRIQLYDANMGNLTGTLIHETGHNVDKNHEALANEYKEAAGWEKIADEKALTARLEAQGVDAKLIADVLKTKGMKTSTQEPVLINGKYYAYNINPAGGGQFVCYDADSLPRLGTAEKTTAGWRDEWDYARTAGADAFADHYKLAVRDPLRVYGDFVERPNDMVDRAEADMKKGVDEQGNPTTPEKAAERLAQAVTQRDGLMRQYKIMREKVLGVDDQVILDIANRLPPEADLDKFYEQADRCQTPEQLEKLRDLYTDPGKHPVDDDAIEDAAGGLKDDKQRAAFKKDAQNCFTPEQLDRLKQAYDGGKRAVQKDAAGRWTEDRGEWVLAAGDPEQTSILGW